MRAGGSQNLLPLLLSCSLGALTAGFQIQPLPVGRTPSTASTPQQHQQHQRRVGPLHSSLGSMFGKMIAGALKGPAPAPDMSGFQDAAPSWGELAALLASQQTDAERQLPELRKAGRGPTSSKAELRLFDAPDGHEPRVTLYRDTASWCPYCQKVWMYLEEKRIPYRVSKVPMRCYGQKPAWFSRLSATGLLPVAEIDGVGIVTESDVILQTLEDQFPDATPLLPLASDPKAAAVGPLLRLERELFSAWLRWLTGSTVTNDRSKLAFENTLGRVEEALGASGGPYFLGGFFSVIDCIFAPFLERMAGSLAFYKGFRMRGSPTYPNLERWFQAMETRESFRGIKSDWYTHALDLPPQVGSCTMTPEGEPVAREISGKDGSWTLPLKEEGGVEPLLPGVDAAAARREAAAQLIANPEAVARFAARALGEPGVPPVMAELSDPNAKANEAYVGLLDTALRAVAQALLSGPEAARPAVAGLVAGERVAAGLDYLRARVGVPRDMSFEAARVFRAHLGWAIDQLVAK